MTILIFSFFMLSALAQDSQLKDCQEFNREVLNRAVFEVNASKLKDHEHPYRFVEDEKLAVKYLESFEPTRLQLYYNDTKRKVFTANCRDPEKDSKERFLCDSSMSSLNFFRALIWGVKNYQWSEKTKQLGIKKMHDYVEYVSNSPASLLDIAIAGSLLRIATEEKLIQKPTRAEIVVFNREIDQESERLSLLMKARKKPVNCQDVKDALRDEELVIKKLMPALKDLAKR